MTLKHELVKKYHKKQEICICLASSIAYNKGTIAEIEHLVHGETVTFKPPVKGYVGYSHGACLDHVNMYYKNKVLRNDSNYQ